MITIMTIILAGPSAVLFQAGKGIFLFSKTSYSGTRPSPYSMANKGSFPRDKSAGTQS